MLKLTINNSLMKQKESKLITFSRAVCKNLTRRLTFFKIFFEILTIIALQIQIKNEAQPREVCKLHL